MEIKIYPRGFSTPPDQAGSGVTLTSLTCANCSSGYRSDPGALDCSECGLGYYSNPVSQTCTVCPVGTKCPTTTTPAPVDCGAGYYQGQSTQSNCLPCPVGKYCDLGRTVTPISCPAGSFRDMERAVSSSDCQVCSSGKYSLDIARSTDCPLCEADNYCPNSTTVKACPANTVSSAGSSSLLHCRCEAGFKCSYTKKITAVVTLNTTAASFNNPQDPVRIAFIAAVAAAAGVNPAQVTIGHVRSKLGGRRLLSLESQDSQPDEFIDVHTSIDGAIRLHRLDLHLAGHSATLHQGHTWQEAHGVRSSAMLRRPVLST